ncbi:MAG: (d)CMP kinase [Acidobacteriota bacterium]|nr:(d)CMP kinase [Acidobacteriota bacterium]MDE3043799.1 (d)CMP kinase [Acidobacteriota bacterium]MDE3106693.1 (d)CMP kinase [Acidobacteriota bacterium]MDE3223235.1 (d)CMP kinase [Acidobacteriota bacterium]
MALVSALIIAIDGPAGSGKSTVARALAERLGWSFLDTGAMYRAITVEALRRQLNVRDDAALAALSASSVVRTLPRVTINGRDVEDEIRTEPVNEAVSIVAANPLVRASMVARQREFADAQPIGTVVEGRDITTVVFPSATIKVYLSASLEERVRRRGGDEEPASLARRDDADSTRAASPLRVAHDAIEIDTTSRDVNDVVEEIVECLHQKTSS